MENIEGESSTRVLDRYELESQLSALVEKIIISQKIADKLEKKLIEKKVNINQEQLQMLVNKIGEIIRTYNRNDHKIKDESTESKVDRTIENKSITDMRQLFETVDKLKQKISIIETDIIKGDNKKSLPKLVTTDDIKIPKNIIKPIEEFRFDPLTQIPTDAESIIVLMRWLQYLINKCGHSNLSTILDYYIDIGWITNDAKLNLIDYSNGITGDISNRDSLKREITDFILGELMEEKKEIKGKSLSEVFGKVAKWLNNRGVIFRN